MTTRLLLVRHGDSQHKIDGVLGGPRGCRGLTETGGQQAAKLRDRLRRERDFQSPVNLYASILPRAVETARILAEAFPGTTVQQDCGLCTWHTPAEWDGKRWEEYQASHTLAGGGVFLPFEAGNETWAELVARVSRSLLGIAQKHRDQTTVVVAHTETVEASFVTFGSVPLFRPFDLQVANTSLTEWTTEEDPTTWPPGRWTLVHFNDTAHLGE